MTSVVTRRLGETVTAIDGFCGFGGSSQGIHAAGVEVRVAANHDRLSIDCHAANYPDTDHVRADLSNPEAADYLDPVDLPPATFGWFSPSCKFHSQANARKVYAEGPQERLFADGEEFDQEAYANSERSRMTMMCPLRYAARHRPEIVVVENVLEVTAWGPARDGSTFRWWLAEWGRLGYEHECLFPGAPFRWTPSPIVAEVADAIERARIAAPADRTLSWRTHDALDEATAGLAAIDAELDRLAELLGEGLCRECSRMLAEDDDGEGEGAEW